MSHKSSTTPLLDPTAASQHSFGFVQHYQATGHGEHVPAAGEPDAEDVETSSSDEEDGISTPRRYRSDHLSAAQRSEQRSSPVRPTKFWPASRLAVEIFLPVSTKGRNYSFYMGKFWSRCQISSRASRTCAARFCSTSTGLFLGSAFMPGGLCFKSPRMKPSHFASPEIVHSHSRFLFGVSKKNLVARLGSARLGWGRS